MTVLLTGGAGYIGSHTALTLLQAGYDVVAADSLVNASAQALARVEALTGKKAPLLRLDIRDTAALTGLLRERDVRAVIHFAGLKSVPGSVADPTGYYANNLGATISLVQAMEAAGVRDVVFSSSATVYRVERPVLAETSPLGCSSPYGWSKLMSERVLRDAAAAGHIRAVALRYFNPVGAHPSGRIGEDPRGVPGNLMPYLTQTAAGVRDHLNVTGTDYDTPDGTGVRDYLHVMDLARGHLAALDYCQKNPGFLAVNLGTGRGSSVLELIAAFQAATGVAVPWQAAPRRPGDLAAYWADAGLAKKLLGWQAQLGLEDMCRDAWAWQRQNPQGYHEAEEAAV